MKNSILFFAAVLALGFASCKKDDEKTKTELLTASTWAQEEFYFEYNGIKKDATDEFMDACDKDNRYTFSKDAVYKVKVGADDCDGTESDGTGVWSWKENETILSTTIDGQIEEYEIMSINASEYKVLWFEETYDFDNDGKDDKVQLISIFRAK